MTTQALPGFRVALPAKWVELALDPDTRPAAFARLVEERGQAAMAGGSSAAELAGILEGIAAQARAAGAVYAAFSSDVIAGQPVTASLVISTVSGQGPPAPPGADQMTVAGALQRLFSATGATEVRVLPAGPAVRLRRRLEGLAPGGGTAPVDTIRYVVPLPDLERLVLLEFSTPNVALAEPFAELFDAIAGTLTWT